MSNGVILLKGLISPLPLLLWVWDMKTICRKSRPGNIFQMLNLTFDQCFIYLFGVLRRFQHCTGHITTGSWKGRGNQYIEFARVLYCKLPTNGKQLPAFPHKALTGIEPRPQRWEARLTSASGLNGVIILKRPYISLITGAKASECKNRP